nr:hypothetical protein [Tanacetum cinerariifolium]
MALTFVDTHKMIAFLTKSNASEGFEQILDFLNASVIQYALMVNPTIYVSCIKQFWSSVSLKKTNDVVRLQSLIDRRKVIITEDMVRQVLRLDDADSIDCLPNEEIFVELARMDDIDATAEDEDATEPTLPSPTPATTPPPPQQELIFSPPQEIGTEEKVKSFRIQEIEEGGKIAKLDADEDVTLEEVAAEVTMDVDVQGRLEESQTQVYHFDLEHAQKVLSMQDDETEPAELKEVIKVVTTAKWMTKVVTAATTITAAPMPKASAARRRKGVVIRDPEETATSSVIMHSELKACQEKGKSRQYSHEYHPLKRKPQTEAQAKKNMMVYLKNMAGFKMDFFKGMTYDEIRPIFKKHFNSIMAFLDKGEKELKEDASKQSKRKSKTSEEKAAKKQKLNEEVEELKTHLKVTPNDKDDVYTEATPLALKVPVVDYQIHTENNKPYYKIIRADGTHQLFLSFINLLRNFDREDLEML